MELTTKMYLNQKNFFYNVKELSVLLVKDANIRFSKYNQNIMSDQLNKNINVLDIYHVVIKKELILFFMALIERINNLQ